MNDETDYEAAAEIEAMNEAAHRKHVLEDALNAAWDYLPRGYSARDSIENVRAQFDLTDDEADYLVDKLSGC